jgi:hypothetical protein
MPLECRHHTPGSPTYQLAPLPPASHHALPFDSAAHVRVQPATELRHFQRHGHELHIQRALRACPWPPSLESGPVHAVTAASYPLSRLPARTSPPITRPPFDSGRGALTPCPPPTSCSSAAPGRVARPLTALLASSRALGLRREVAPREDRLQSFVRDRGGDQGKEEKERVGDERVNQPKHHKSGRDHRRRADARPARESKRLTECRQTGTDWV